MRRATRRVSQLYDTILAPTGLRSTQRSILIHIARAGTPSMGQLAASLVLDRSALAHNLKPLERDGLVQVVVDARDRRTRLVALTAAGRAKLAESMPLWEQAQQRFERVFGAAQAAALRASLDVIASDDFARAFQDAWGPSDAGGDRQTSRQRSRGTWRPAHKGSRAQRGAPRTHVGMLAGKADEPA